MTKLRKNLTAPRHADPMTPAARVSDFSAGVAAATKQNCEAVSERISESFRRTSVVGRTAVLTVLAVTTVGAPVNAMLQTEAEPAVEPPRNVQSVVVTAHGSFEVADPAEGVSALGAADLSEARDGAESSRSGRDDLGEAPADETGAADDVADGASSETAAPEAQETAPVEGETATETPASDDAAADEAASDEQPADGAEPTEAPAEEPTAPAEGDAAAEATEPASDAPAEEPAEGDAATEQPMDAPAEGETPAEGDAPAQEPVDDAEPAEGDAPADAPAEDSDAVGEPSEEGGIPVSEDETAGTDVPDADLPPMEEVQEVQPVLAADETAVWSVAAPVLDGIGVIAATANTDRAEIIAEAKDLLAETEGKVSDDALRGNVSAAITTLEAAADSASVESAVTALDEQLTILEDDYVATSGTLQMQNAAAEAQSAISRGRAYDPAGTLDFGSNGSFYHPVPNGRFTSAYGPRWGGMHNGVDLAAPAGTPIYVAADGVVTYVGYGHSSRGLSGWIIIVSHGNGLETAYNHMYADGVLVSEGQAVSAGEQIAEVGNSGRSTGPHLHLSVWQNGQTVNPVTYFSGRGISLR